MAGNITPARVEIAADQRAWADRGAELVIAAASDAIRQRGQFLLALSGGSTPVPLYDALAVRAASVDWERTQIFFSDERFVPPDSPESNFRMCDRALLTKIPIPERFVHLVDTVAIDPAEAAVLYAQGIRRVAEVSVDEVPHLDLILLGLGEDGHTASLFPGTEALTIRDQIVAANFVPKRDQWRITFTYPLINAGRIVTFGVRGKAKAPVVAGVLNGDMRYPASAVRPMSGELIWLLDDGAASDVGSA